MQPALKSTKYLLPLVSLPLFAPRGSRAVGSASTVPMQLELNRPYIEVHLEGPNGRDVKARTWVDTGDGAIILSADLARRLGLKPTGKATRNERAR